METQKIREAYETLLQAIELNKVKQVPGINRVDEVYSKIRQLQNIAVYLNIIK